MEQLDNYIKYLAQLLDNRFSLPTLKNDTRELLNTDYVINQGLIEVRSSKENHTNYEIVYHLIKKVIREGLFNNEDGDNWPKYIQSSKSDTLIPKKLKNKIPANEDLNNECATLVDQIHSIVSKKLLQLKDTFVFSIPSSFYQVSPKIFFIGEIHFTNSTIIFIPYGESLEFHPNPKQEENIKDISKTATGLVARSFAFQERQKILVSAARKQEIQMGMNLFQKFIYNVDAKDVDGSKNNYSLFIDKESIKEISIDDGVLYINTKSEQFLFGSLVLRIIEEEVKNNLNYWLKEQFSNVTKSSFISTTIAPKLLLDGLINNKQFSSELIEEFFKDDKQSLHFFRLYKGISYGKTQVLNQISNLSKPIYNKLTDDKFLSQISAIEQNESNDSRCFIATAVYDDSNSESVRLLRKFRDKVLNSYLLGKIFIKFYYRYSPTVADYLINKKYLKATIKIYILNPIIWLIKKGLTANSQYK